VTISDVSRALAVIAAIVLCACSSVPTATVSRPLVESADAPYEKILVVTLLDSFDARRYLEEETVNELARRGVSAVRSTSMMNSKTPIVAQTFIDMIEEIGADGLLLTQLTSYGVTQKEKDANPQATYNYWPTYYYNVWQVELTEYVEPPRLQTNFSLLLATEMFSVQSREPVWAIETRPKFTEEQEDGMDYQIFVDEAQAIVNAMSRGKVIR
jgi:hypothetical protein